MPGYPIRTPWDHSSVDSSPRPIAASHVLHRPLVPRHPPYAHSNLTTQQHASTQNRATRIVVAQTDTYAITTKLKDARIHCAILNQHRNPHRLSAATLQAHDPTVLHADGDSTKPTTAPYGAGCFRTQQDVCPPPPAAPHQTRSTPPRVAPQPLYLDGWPLPAVTFTSVSAIEHPTTSNAPRGPLAPLRVQGAP